MIDVDYAALKQEITTDPLALGYSGMADADVADAMNAVTRTKVGSIPSAELLAWSAQKDDRPRIIKIREAATLHASEDVRAIAIAADLLITRDNTTLDLSQPDRMQMVDALVAGGVLTATDKSSLVALATVPCSRGDELGLGRITPSHVAKAKKLP